MHRQGFTENAFGTLLVVQILWAEWRPFWRGKNGSSGHGDARLFFSADAVFSRKVMMRRRKREYAQIFS